MVLTKKNVLMASAGVALAFNFSACKKDKDSQTDKLVGEWEVLTQDGDPIDDGYLSTFVFEADKDFSYCYEEIGADKYCYTGDWEWGNDDETEVDLDISYGGYNIIAVLEIDELTDDVLEGDLKVDGYSTSFTMKKKN